MWDTRLNVLSYSLETAEMMAEREEGGLSQVISRFVRTCSGS